MPSSFDPTGLTEDVGWGMAKTIAKQVDGMLMNIRDKIIEYFRKYDPSFALGEHVAIYCNTCNAELVWDEEEKYFCCDQYGAVTDHAFIGLVELIPKKYQFGAGLLDETKVIMINCNFFDESCLKKE